MRIFLFDKNVWKIIIWTLFVCIVASAGVIESFDIQIDTIMFVIRSCVAVGGTDTIALQCSYFKIYRHFYHPKSASFYASFFASHQSDSNMFLPNHVAMMPRYCFSLCSSYFLFIFSYSKMNGLPSVSLLNVIESINLCSASNF